MIILFPEEKFSVPDFDVSLKGSKIFLLKWGFTIKFFKKYYLKSDDVYNGPLQNPKRNLTYFINLFKCKIYLIYLKIFFKF